jgi:type I restriction-modification system DNA methylase subunit/restriction endonuclease S subunit
MPEYICELCKKVFKQKGDYTKHTKNKKTPCISLKEIEKISLKKDDKVNLVNVLKNFLNILRDNEALTGDKALKNINYLLILKLLEPKFGNEINIDEHQYDFSHIEDKMVENHKNKLLSIVRFSNLAKEKEVNLPINIKYLWEDILSKHPKTRKIYLQDKFFDIQKQSTFYKLIQKLNSIDFSKNEYDILGNSYEEVIKDVMTGKVLGQFFTQPLVKNFMVKLIEPKIHNDGKIETCGDPTMGTGGFLISYLQYILKQAKNKNIEPDWEFITKQGLYGKEIESDTYQLAVSNMLISSGHMFDSLEKGDSIREPITTKFDNILANPPYGIKGLKYDDFQNSLKNEYVPIKSDNAVSLFIQAIIYMLKINGKCAVVLPDGQDLFSKTNKTLITVREYLLKTCDLKEIIYLPSGIFTNTSIKTCIFYFIKKREGKDVLQINSKISKEQKETGRNYKFSKTLQTHKIYFYEYNPYEDVKNLLVEVPIEKIVENSYSLNYSEYIKDHTEEQYEEDIVMKTLGEVCKFLPKSKRQASYGEKRGKYPFFKSSIKVDSYVDEADYDEESLIIGDGGEPNINYGIKFSTSDHCYILQNKNKLLLNLKYAYYYLYHNLDMMKQLYTGVAIKNISKINIEGIKIPIPSLDKQQKIGKYLDFIYEKTNKTSYEKISELKQLNEFSLNNQKIFGENVVKELGDVFKEVKTGKDVVATDRKKGEYPFYGANGIIDYVDSYIFDGKYLLTARTGSLGSLHISNGKFWCSGDVHRMEFENDTLLSYTYYYLQTVDFQKFRTGSAHPKLSGSSLKSIKIHIPSLERQKEIVEYCEYNDKLIKQLEIEIENNKKQAKNFITNVLKQINEKTYTINEKKDETNNEQLIQNETEAPLGRPLEEIKEKIVKTKKEDIESKSKYQINDEKKDETIINKQTIKIEQEQIILKTENKKYSENELKKFGITKLKDICKEIKISGYSKFKSGDKEEVIKKILNKIK